MANVVLIIHLILALAIIGVVLLQRSEGGGLGMGGGGGGAGGVMSGRAAATALGKITWGLAIAFIATSLTLTILAAADSEGGNVLDRITDAPRSSGNTDLPAGEDLLPPSLGDDPLVPQSAD
ncbi:MAG: preprotein translocase subunit SecG [Pseudomonadota bacterium]